MVEPQDFQAQGERNGDTLRANKLLTSSCGRSHDLSVRQQQKGHKILHLTSNKFLQSVFLRRHHAGTVLLKLSVVKDLGFLFI